MSLIYSRPRIKLPKFFIVNNRKPFKNKKIPLVFKEETLLKFILRNMKGED